MAYVGEEKVVNSKASKSELERRLGSLNDLNVAFISSACGFLAGTLASSVIGVCGGAVADLAISSAIEKDLLSTRDTVKRQLELVRSNRASGIMTKTTMRYTYMSGSGTSWVKSGKATTSTY